MDGTSTQIHRRIIDVADARAAETPVLLLQGPRSVGKSTTLAVLAARTGGVVLDLDDPVVAADAEANPSSFLPAARHTYIDEYQRAPVLLESIKTRLNKDGSPGQFVLAGSTSYNALPRGTQALTGRLHRLPVYPLAQCEIDGTPGGVLARLYADPGAELNRIVSSADRSDYTRRVLAGGFPLALRAGTPAARTRWFEDYLAQASMRDVAALGPVRRPAALRALLGLLAARTGQVLNVASVAQAAGLTEGTASSYLDLLKNAFLVHQLDPWSTVTSDRSFRKPKVHVLDSGVAGHLARLTEAKLEARRPEALSVFGHVLESFAVAELMKEASWLDDVLTLGYWRTYDGLEVDLIIERSDGHVLAFEVKAAQRLKDGDLDGLRALRDKLGPSLIAGVVLHTGYRSANPEDRLFTMPLDHLWRSGE